MAFPLRITRCMIAITINPAAHRLSRALTSRAVSDFAINSTMHFIDIAANLTDGMYQGEYGGNRRHDPDLATVLSRARDAGVVRTMVTAGTLSQSREALSMCSSDASLFCTVGVHPTRAAEMLHNPDEYVRHLMQVVKDGKDKVVAIGECGLDFDRAHFCSKEDQMPGFLAQFELAEKTGLPMFLHDRNTGGDFGRVVRDNRSRFCTGVVHSFTGTMEEMREYVDMDLYIGINGCSLKTEENLRVARAVPLDRLMLETDCPYCEIRSTHAGSGHVKSKWPSKDKKRYVADALVKGRNEPCQVRQVCEVLAAIRNESEEDVARACFNNTMMVFFKEECANMGSCPYEWSVNAVSSLGGSLRDGRTPS